jgi:hypothetical protein
VSVSNPLYQRLAGADVFGRDSRGNILRPKIMIEAFLALLRARATGEIADDATLSTRIGEISGYQDAQGVYVPVGLDATETQQATDLIATVVTAFPASGAFSTGTTAQIAARGEAHAFRAETLIKIREILMVLEFGQLTGFGPNDVAGATVGAVGGRLNVARRDSP